MQDFFLVDKGQLSVDVLEELKKSKAEILVCYPPVGSAKAARFYAECALEANVGFINAIPEFICSDESWVKKFKDKNLNLFKTLLDLTITINFNSQIKITTPSSAEYITKLSFYSSSIMSTSISLSVR